MPHKKDERYSAEETQIRFAAALRGARIAGAQHKESASPKKAKARRKKLVPDAKKK
jgi:hypothetical protein